MSEEIEKPAEAPADELARRRALQEQVKRALDAQGAGGVAPKQTLSVPQLLPDACGLYVDGSQVALTLASRFHPYVDGTVNEAPTPFAVVRLPLDFARGLVKQLGDKIQEIDAAIAAHQAAQAQAAAQAKLQAELKDGPHG